MNQKKRIILLALVAIVLVGALGYLYSMNKPAGMSDEDTSLVESTTSTTETSASSTLPNTGTSNVQIAYLDATGMSNGPARGCDKLVMVNTQIATTTAPLDGALQALFASNSIGTTSAYNFIAKTKSTLSYNNVTLTNGVAKIYLSGSLSGLSGVCDDQRAKFQIEDTAKQFPSVQTVELYLNNTLTTLTPSQQ